jgi:Flp pilus assembly protein TadG
MNIRKNAGVKGQDLLEYALLLPFMVLFIMAIFDLGFASLLLSSMNNAAREGARFGSMQENSCNTTSIANLAKSRLFAIDPASAALTVTVNSNATGTAPDCKINIPGTAKVTVNVNYCYKPITPVAIFTLNGLIKIVNVDPVLKCIPIKSGATMYVEM